MPHDQLPQASWQASPRADFPDVCACALALILVMPTMPFHEVMQAKWNERYMAHLARYLHCNFDGVTRMRCRAQANSRPEFAVPKPF